MRQARLGAGESLGSLAERSGVREGLLRTIEDGAFAALPPGIYARAAIRSYAVAVGFDPVEILDACADALPEPEEPISGLGRLHGVRQPAVTRAPAAPEPSADVSSGFSWRPIAAAAIDAGVIAALFGGLIVCARVAIAVPLARLGPSAAVALAMMGVLFGAGYFVWIGGLTGATAGERVTGLRRQTGGASRATLRVIGARAWRGATEDLRGFAAAGAWVRVRARPFEEEAGRGCGSSERFAAPATADD